MHPNFIPAPHAPGRAGVRCWNTRVHRCRSTGALFLLSAESRHQLAREEKDGGEEPLEEHGDGTGALSQPGVSCYTGAGGGGRSPGPPADTSPGVCRGAARLCPGILPSCLPHSAPAAPGPVRGRHREPAASRAGLRAGGAAGPPRLRRAPRPGGHGTARHGEGAAPGRPAAPSLSPHSLTHSPGRRRPRFSSAASARSAAAPAAPAASAAAAPAAAAPGLRRRGSSFGPAPRPHTAAASSRSPRPCRIPAGLRRAEPLSFPSPQPQPRSLPQAGSGGRAGAASHAARSTRAPSPARRGPGAAGSAGSAAGPARLPRRGSGRDKVQVMSRVEEARAGKGRKSC